MLLSLTLAFVNLLNNRYRNAYSSNYSDKGRHIRTNTWEIIDSKSKTRRKLTFASLITLKKRNTKSKRN